MSVATATQLEEPFVDSAWTAKHSEAHIRTGPPNNSVTAEVNLAMQDAEIGGLPPRVYVYWKMWRYVREEGVREGDLVFDYPNPHGDLDYKLDEIEAFATALYQAVQNAKKAGYLP